MIKVYSVVTKAGIYKDVDCDYELKKGERWAIVNGMEAPKSKQYQKRLK